MQLQHIEGVSHAVHHYTKVWNGEYCSREAYALHQQFKEDFLVKSRDEITIPAQTITEWIEHNLKTHLIG